MLLKPHRGIRWHKRQFRFGVQLRYHLVDVLGCRYLTGQVDKRTLEKYEREAKEKNRETWYLSWALDTNQEERDKVSSEMCDSVSSGMCDCVGSEMWDCVWNEMCDCGE